MFIDVRVDGESRMISLLHVVQVIPWKDGAEIEFVDGTKIAIDDDYYAIKTTIVSSRAYIKGKEEAVPPSVPSSTEKRSTIPRLDD